MVNKIRKQFELFPSLLDTTEENFLLSELKKSATKY
jgi:hypothetical protein